MPDSDHPASFDECPYRYLVGYADSYGNIGSMSVGRTAPIRGEAERTEVQEFVRRQYPGAVVLSFSRYED